MDDIIYVNRLHLLSLTWNNLKLWSQPVLGLWSPFVGWSFMLDYLVWGKEHLFFGAHLVNILLHLAACAAFYAGARMLKFPRIAAGLAVLFWALHPQRAESVAWLSERKDVLLLALGLWSIVLFIQWMKEKKRFQIFLSVLFFALSFLIKPALIGLPAVLTAFLWGRYRKKDWRFYVKYSGIYWLISLVYYGAFKIFVPAGDLLGAETFSERFIVTGWRYGSYLVKTFIPYGLNPYYPHFSLADNSLWPLYITGLLCLLLLVFLRQRDKKALYLHLPLLVSFSAAVAPGLLKIGDVDFADRYSYFPSVFAVLALFAGAAALRKRLPLPGKWLILILCGITVCWGVLCFDRVFLWENEEVLAAAVLDVPKPNYRRLIADTVVKYNRKDLQGVKKNISRLRQHYGNDPAPRPQTVQLFTESMEGLLIVAEGNPAGMEKVLRVLSHPRWQLIFNSTISYPRFLLLKSARYAQLTGRRKEAAGYYRKAAELYGMLEPLEKEFYLALAALCLGDRTTALKHFENAHKLNPADENVRKNIESLRRGPRK